MSKIILRHYIIDLLHQAGFSKWLCLSLTTPDYMEIFAAAFMTKSYNYKHNYEYYEFVGDLIINNTLTTVIMDKFKDIDDINFLSKVISKLRSKDVFIHRCVKHRVSQTLFIKGNVTGNHRHISD